MMNTECSGGNVCKHLEIPYPNIMKSLVKVLNQIKCCTEKVEKKTKDNEKTVGVNRDDIQQLMQDKRILSCYWLLLKIRLTVLAWFSHT